LEWKSGLFRIELLIQVVAVFADDVELNAKFIAANLSSGYFAPGMRRVIEHGVLIVIVLGNKGAVTSCSNFHRLFAVFRFGGGYEIDVVFRARILLEDFRKALVINVIGPQDFEIDFGFGFLEVRQAWVGNRSIGQELASELSKKTFVSNPDRRRKPWTRVLWASRGDADVVAGFAELRGLSFVEGIGVAKLKTSTSSFVPKRAVA
jgi:hypothetical protein